MGGFNVIIIKSWIFVSHDFLLIITNDILFFVQVKLGQYWYEKIYYVSLLNVCYYMLIYFVFRLLIKFNTLVRIKILKDLTPQDGNKSMIFNNFV